MAENSQDQDQKTEQPTPQRIQKARQDGQVGYSAEFVAGIMMLVASLLGLYAGESLWNSMGDTLRARITNMEAQVESPEMLINAFTEDTLGMAYACFAVVGPLALVAIATGLLQTQFNLSSKPLNIDWNKTNPASGFKKIFSMKNWVKGGLSLVKAACIVTVCVVVLMNKLPQTNWSDAPTFMAFFSEFNSLLMQLALSCSVVLLIAGAIDFGFQRWKYIQDLRMSPYEIKQENKETEGDPMIRARIKRLQQEARKQRMFQEIPDSTVVVRNPTHFAVALKYEEDQHDAPMVVAKGADFLALKIIELAEESDVPVVENKAVARYLYKNVELGQPIPLNLYQAVAEIISFVRKLKDKAA